MIEAGKGETVSKDFDDPNSYYVWLNILVCCVFVIRCVCTSLCENSYCTIMAVSPLSLPPSHVERNWINRILYVVERG